MISSSAGYIPISSSRATIVLSRQSKMLPKIVQTPRSSSQIKHENPIKDKWHISWSGCPNNKLYNMKPIVEEWHQTRNNEVIISRIHV